MIRKGFTLVEILIGLSVSAAIFLVATSFVVNVFDSDTKSKQKALFAQVKNDLQTEFGNTVRWGSSISFAGEFVVDETVYRLQDGRLYKNGVVITPSTIEITEFTVLRHLPESAPSGVGSGLTGQYFNEPDLSELIFTQEDFLVDFDWGTGSPDPLIDSDTFSIRWSGQVEAPVNGNYTFYVSSDEGAKLWVDNTLLIDDWDIPGHSERSGNITLAAGVKYDIRLLYWENFGDASARLAWKYPGVAKETIPTNKLYPRSGPVSLTITVKMRLLGSVSQVDDLRLILSPRSGSVSTIE